MKMAENLNVLIIKNDMEMKTYVNYHGLQLVVYVHFKIVFD